MRNLLPSRMTWLFVLLFASATVLLGGCASQPAQEPDGSAPEEQTGETTAGDEDSIYPDEPLLILEWSGYEVTEYPYLFPSFAETYTPSIELAADYVFFADDGEALAKMQSGIGADLVHPCESWWGFYVDNDLLQPIDTSRLMYWDQIAPDLAALGNFNGEQYILPWDWGYESILVRTDLVEEVPDSWGDLWDPQYAGKVIMWDSAQPNYAVAALALGYEDPWAVLSEQTVEEARQKLIELKPNLLTYWTDYTETYDLPANGDAWLTGLAWQDAYAYLASEGYEVEYIEPAEKRLGWVCGFGISKDAENLDLVYEFLNAASSPESSAALGNVYWYGGANTAAIDLVDDYVVDFMQLDEFDTLFDRTIFYKSLSESDRQMIQSMWDEVKAAP